MSDYSDLIDLDAAVALPTADFVRNPFDPKDPGLRGIGSGDFPMKTGGDMRVKDVLLATLTVTLEDGRVVPPAALSPNGLEVYHPEKGVFVHMDKGLLERRIFDLETRGLYYEAQDNDDGPTQKRWSCAATKPNQIVKAAIAAVHTKPDHPLRNPRPGLACQSGFVRASPRGLIVQAHSPDHGAQWYYDAPLTAWEKVKTTDAFARSLMRRFFYGDEEAPGLWADNPEREHLIDLLLQVLYIGLTGQGARYHRQLLIIGPAGTGKSQIAEMAQAILGDRGVGSVQPSKFGDDKHGAALDGVALNAVTELDSDPIPFGPLKAVISGEPVTRRPVYCDPVTFRFRGQCLYITNSYPEIIGAESAAWDRWLLLRWEAPRFRDTDAVVENIGRKVAGQGNCITTVDPDSGFLIERPDPDRDMEARTFILAAVMHAGVMLEKTGLILPDMHSEEMSRWQSEGDPIRAWMAEQTVVLPEEAPVADGTQISTLHDAYKAWAKQAGLSPVSRIDLSRRLLDFQDVEDEDGNVHRLVRRRSDGARFNLKLKSQMIQG